VIHKTELPRPLKKNRHFLNTTHKQKILQIRRKFFSAQLHALKVAEKPCRHPIFNTEDKTDTEKPGFSFLKNHKRVIFWTTDREKATF
jgi:hypothetical protein